MPSAQVKYRSRPITIVVVVVAVRPVMGLPQYAPVPCRLQVVTGADYY